jgi:hypothetical protein
MRYQFSKEKFMNNTKDVLVQLKSILEDNKDILADKLYGFSESID